MASHAEQLRAMAAYYRRVADDLDRTAKSLEGLTPVSSMETRITTRVRNTEEALKEEHPGRKPRHGTHLEKAVQLLKKEGKPLHISSIVTATGVAQTSMAGTLERAVRQGDLTKVAPATYAIAEDG